MNEQSPSKQKYKNVPLITVSVLTLIAVSSITQLNLRVGQLESKIDQASQKTTAADDSNSNPYTTVTSGKSGFTMNVPNGWGPLIRDTSGDWFIIDGMQQPTLGAGAVTKVRDISGYGSDSASVFYVSLSKDGFGDVPRGYTEEFTIGKSEDALPGKKYSYIYPKDDVAGIGYLRSQNDREYSYTFTTKDGRKLVVVYNVYGSDPRNLVTTVDEIVHSIVIK